jgi:hypothetical protein
MSKLLLAALVASSSLAFGCAGARASIVLPESKYPVSLSNGMLGQNREILTGEEMQVVGKFHEERTAWGMLYSFIPFTPHLDVSEAINAQVERAGGQGIVRLRTSSKPCALDYFVLFTIIPFWPGCTSVELDGDIIKRQEAPPTKPQPR